MGIFFGALFMALVRWFFILSWRFFTGNFMNGKERNDATWWRDASPTYKKRRKSWSWWKRKSRMKRAAWRHSFFWAACLLAVGFWWSADNMIIILCWASPVVGYYLFFKLRPVFYIEQSSSRDGVTEYFWCLKPRYRRLLDLFRIPEKQPKMIPVPPEYERAVREELRVDPEIGRQPITKLQLLLDPGDDEEFQD